MRQPPKFYVPLMDNGDGKVCTQFMECFLQAFSGIRFEGHRFSDSHPGRARNRAAASFLESDCTHLLFIDADIVFTPEHIKLLSECDENIVAGLYPKKNANALEWCLVTLPDKGGVRVPAGELMEIKRAGTGFLCISREVFLRLKALCAEYTNHGRAEWDFFQSGVQGSEWLSEDWYFCDIARTAGFRVMAHSGIQLRHLGVFEYPAKPDRLNWCPPQMRYHIERIWDGEYYIHGLTPRTVLDIGANIGGFAMWAREIWPGCSVESYEPHPENCAVFAMNLRGEADVTLHHFAVLSGSGALELSEGGNIGEHSFHHATQTKTVTVHAVAAGTLPSADFVKIDTEGCELEILQHLPLERTTGVALEYHRETDVALITDYLVNHYSFQPCGHEKIEKDRGILKFRK